MVKKEICANNFGSESALKVQDVLNVAKTFLILQFNADIDSVRFLSATLSYYLWTVRCFFKEKGTSKNYVVNMKINDTSREVQGFSVEHISEE